VCVDFDFQGMTRGRVDGSRNISLSQQKYIKSYTGYNTNMFNVHNNTDQLRMLNSTETITNIFRSVLGIFSIQIEIISVTDTEIIIDLTGRYAEYCAKHFLKLFFMYYFVCIDCLGI